jgi:alpha-ketoglutarate-dependent 2,4-dichlorophenoxyacetate dioxygenase
MIAQIKQLHPSFAAEVTGIDIASGLDAGDFTPALGAVASAMDQYGVVVLRGQRIDNEQQIDFATRFGDIEPSVTRYNSGYKQRIDRREIVDVSNLDENDKPRAVDDKLRMLLLGNRLWHTDSSFRPVPGALSMLYARSIPPEGGETEFTDNRTAYDTLADRVKYRLEGLQAEHSLMHSREQLGFYDFSAEERAALPPAMHPVVRVAASGRKALYIGSHASHIVGWPVPEGRMLLRDLVDHATRREFVHVHRWQVGDLLIWDNRCTMHRGMAYDESFPRDLRRVTTSDSRPELSVLDALLMRRETAQTAT